MTSDWTCRCTFNTLAGSICWRRGWDSNPRYAINVCLFSRQVPSSTRPPLRARYGCLQILALRTG